MRKPFDEDVLVRALAFCQERGLRFGQFLFNVVRETIVDSEPSRIGHILFNIENERLETWIMAAISKANDRSKAEYEVAQAWESIIAGCGTKINPNLQEGF